MNDLHNCLGYLHFTSRNGFPKSPRYSYCKSRVYLVSHYITSWLCLVVPHSKLSTCAKTMPLSSMARGLHFSTQYGNLATVAMKGLHVGRCTRSIPNSLLTPCRYTPMYYQKLVGYINIFIGQSFYKISQFYSS